jgi:hypothetical protein
MRRLVVALSAWRQYADSLASVSLGNGDLIPQSAWETYPFLGSHEPPEMRVQSLMSEKNAAEGGASNPGSANTLRQSVEPAIPVE